MNSRERLLASLVGLLLVLLVSYFVYRKVSTAVARRQGSINALQRDLEKQDRTIRQGSQAGKTLQALQLRSLPKEREQARSAYQQWLLDRVDRVGFREPTVRATDRTIRGRFFDQLSFQVDAEATLQQVVEFLHQFYSTDDLHRIQLLTLQPIKGTQDLDVIIWIEALILPGSQRATVGDVASNRMQGQTLSDLQQVILERSMFLPANIPPSLAEIGKQEIPRGKPFSLKVNASDPDQLQKLTYALVGTAPEGAQLDVATGELRWTPAANGSYDFALQVTDDGTPRRSDDTSFQLVVVDPPPEQPAAPPEPSFDEAATAFLVGTILNGENRQLWLMVRATGKMEKLSVGDTLRVGKISGTIHRIGERDADIRTDDGDLRVRVGQSLTEAKQVN